MKVAVTGAAGLFGCGLVKVFKERHTVFALTRAEADITREDEVKAVVAELRPEIIVHPAGTPDLDICEADPAKGYLVNVHGTRNVVEAARAVGALVALISTDAVFDDSKHTPYLETEVRTPPTVYGRTKRRAEEIVEGEPRHWVFRVSALFGPGKTNFVEKGIIKLQSGETWEVAGDQVGSATYTLDAAAKIMEVIEARRYGLYHLSNQGVCSRLDLALKTAELAGLDASRVAGKPSGTMGRRARRLKYAVMEMAALKHAGFALPRPWTEALGEYIRSRG